MRRDETRRDEKRDEPSLSKRESLKNFSLMRAKRKSRRDLWGAWRGRKEENKGVEAEWGICR